MGFKNGALRKCKKEGEIGFAGFCSETNSYPSGRGLYRLGESTFSRIKESIKTAIGEGFMNTASYCQIYSLRGRFVQRGAGRVRCVFFSLLAAAGLAGIPSAWAGGMAPYATTLPVTQITGTNAVLNGAVTPNAAPASGWFEWGTNTAYGNVAVVSASSNGLAFVSATISNLTAGTV